MKREDFMKSLAILIVIPFLFIAACKNEKKSTSTQKYTCSMHPQVIKDAPGSCPVCGMDLVPVGTAGNAFELTLSESQIQLANITTMLISPDNFSAFKVLNARLIANPELSETISAKYPGRVEQLFIKETGRRVSAGEPLFRIYSEELQTLQQDYLLQVRQAAAFPNEKIYITLRDAAKNKLRLFGYSDSRIENLNRSNKTSPLITVYATVSGIVNEVNISEGQYVTEGTPVLRLENLSQLWVEADVYPSEAGAINPGTSVKVSVTGFPGYEQNAKISFISPQIDPSSQVLKVRAAIQNNGSLQPGMQARVLLPGAERRNAIALPLDAVIRDARGAHVWIKTGKGKFAPRAVTTGEEDPAQIIITSGLGDVKEVVVSGAYLLSSEYILKHGPDSMTGNEMRKM